MNTPGRYQGFLSYRRDDTRHFVGRLREVFRRDLPDDLVFFDVDSIDAGVPFQNAIDHAISGAAVVLVVIGPGWLDMTGPGGRRRLDDADDPVRLEIETALRHGVELLPVLVDDARMPNAHELPASLAELSSRNATRVRSDMFDSDAAQVVHEVDGLVAAASPERRPASGETFRATGSAASSWVVGGVLLGMTAAFPAWVFAFSFDADDAEYVWINFAASALLGATVAVLMWASFGFRDRLTVNASGIEVRQAGLIYRFPWREVDRIGAHGEGTSVFLVARTVSDRLKMQYSGRRVHWPRWDARAGHLVICDLKARVSGGQYAMVAQDRYAACDYNQVERAVRRYKPRGGYDGMRDRPRKSDRVPSRGPKVALTLCVAVLVTISGMLFVAAKDDGGLEPTSPANPELAGQAPRSDEPGVVQDANGQPPWTITRGDRTYVVTRVTRKADPASGSSIRIEIVGQLTVGEASDPFFERFTVRDGDAAELGTGYLLWGRPQPAPGEPSPFTVSVPEGATPATRLTIVFSNSFAFGGDQQVTLRNVPIS